MPVFHLTNDSAVVHGRQEGLHQDFPVLGIRQLPHELLEPRVVVIAHPLAGPEAFQDFIHGAAGQQRYLLGIDPQIGNAGPSRNQVGMFRGQPEAILPVVSRVKDHDTAAYHHTQPFFDIARVEGCVFGDLFGGCRFFHGIHDVEKTGPVAKSHGQVQGTVIQNIRQFPGKRLFLLSCIGSGHRWAPHPPDSIHDRSDYFQKRLIYSATRRPIEGKSERRHQRLDIRRPAGQGFLIYNHRHHRCGDAPEPAAPRLFPTSSAPVAIDGFD
jgi:hypothetical protein